MKIVAIFLILLSFSSVACFSPIGGPEYDNRIEITQIGKNKYSIKFPLSVEGINSDGKVALGYTDDDPRGIKLDEEYQSVNTSLNGEYFVGTFDLTETNKTPYVTVSWWPKECCFCGVIASKKVITSE